MTEIKSQQKMCIKQVIISTLLDYIISCNITFLWMLASSLEIQKCL